MSVGLGRDAGERETMVCVLSTSEKQGREVRREKREPRQRRLQRPRGESGMVFCFVL